MPRFDAADAPEGARDETEAARQLGQSMRRFPASSPITPAAREALSRVAVGDHIRRLVAQAASVDRFSRSLAEMAGAGRVAQSHVAALAVPHGFGRLAAAHTALSPALRAQLRTSSKVAEAVRRSLAVNLSGLAIPSNLLAVNAASVSLAASRIPTSTIATLLSSLTEVPTPAWARSVGPAAFARVTATAARHAAAHPDAGAVSAGEVEVVASDLRTCGFTRAFHRVCAAAQANPATCTALLTDFVVVFLMSALSWAAMADPTLLNEVDQLVGILLAVVQVVAFVMDHPE